MSKREMEELDSDEWLIGLASWVIQDGNYTDFGVGERRRFAVGFFDDGLQPGAPGPKEARAIGEGIYEVSGEVVVAARDVVVLDFGLLAYADSRPPSVDRGDWLSGRVALEVDCYSYFEIHARKRGVPAAVYTWTVTGIWRQTAPFVPDPDHGPRSFKRDPNRRGWARLDRTNADSDDGGSAEYLIRCRLQADAPTRHP